MIILIPPFLPVDHKVRKFLLRHATFSILPICCLLQTELLRARVQNQKARPTTIVVTDKAPLRVVSVVASHKAVDLLGRRISLADEQMKTRGAQSIAENARERTPRRRCGIDNFFLRESRPVLDTITESK